MITLSAHWFQKSARYGALVAAGILLAGCGQEDPLPTPQAIEQADRLTPSDPRLAAIYERSCRTCHSQAAAQAPLTGFVPHWTPRLAQGMATLIQHAREGFRGMPARGFCADCTDDNYEALIRFMSAPSQP